MNPGVSSELLFGKQTSVRFDFPAGALGVGCGEEAFFPGSSARFLTSGMNPLLGFTWCLAGVCLGGSVRGWDRTLPF